MDRIASGQLIASFGDENEKFVAAKLRRQTPTSYAAAVATGQATERWV
jgi:hypothetical protein